MNSTELAELDLSEELGAFGSSSIPALSSSPGAPLLWAISRPLYEADWLSPKGAKAPPLKEIRRSHHQVAKLLAQGERPGRVSILTGYSASRISILQADPAFAELVSFYAKHLDEVNESLSDRLRMLTLDTLEVIHERVREVPESVPTEELRQVAEMGLDRIGFGKASKQLNLTVAMTADELRELRESIQDPLLRRGELLSHTIAGEAEDFGVAGGHSLERVSLPEAPAGAEGTEGEREGI